MVEAIIRLPGGLVPFRPGYETALWVLTQARDSRWRGRVLLADVSDRELTHAGDQRPRGGRDHLAARRLRAGRAPPRVRPSGRGQRPDRPAAAAHDQQPSGESPRARRQTPRAGSPLVTQRGADLDRIGATATADRRHVPTEAARGRRPARGCELRPRAETVGALVKGKLLALHQGTRIKPEHITPARSPRGPRPDEVLGIRRPGRAEGRPRGVRPHATRTPASPSPATSWSPPFPGPAPWSITTATRSPSSRSASCASPRPKRSSSRPRVLAALLFADGSGTRAAGAVRAGRSPGRPAGAPCSRPPRSVPRPAARRDRRPPRPGPPGTRRARRTARCRHRRPHRWNTDTHPATIRHGQDE